MNIHYMRGDIKRLVQNPWFYISILGVTLGLFYGQEGKPLRDSVIAAYWISISLSGFMVLYVFCILPFGLVFCEDLEHYFFRYQIVRGSVVQYVVSKTILIYLSSVLTMALGTGLFALLASGKRPWFDGKVPTGDVFQEGAFGWLIEDGHVFLFILIYAIVLGFLAGTLSVLTAFISLFISNKVMAVALPVCFLQCWIHFLRNSKYLSVYSFHLYTKIFPEDWQCVLLAFVISIVPVCFLTLGIIWKIKKRL